MTNAALAVLSLATVAGGMRPHTVYVSNGSAPPKPIKARLQIVTRSWDRVVAVPYVVYMPEKRRVLMLASCDYPHQAMVLWSDDLGGTWTAPRYVHTDPAAKPDTGMGTGLAYLGKGGVLLYASGKRHFSSDYGETWGEAVPVAPTPDGQTFNQWDPPLVEKGLANGAPPRLIETGYTMDAKLYEAATGPGYEQGYWRRSEDGGRTWGAAVKVPEWYGVSEVALLRARDGALVAACRTDIPATIKDRLDHYEGLAVSRSLDDGRTWSPLLPLYAWGRHHPSMVLLRNGDIVMTYVVRLGYSPAADGFPRFGVEAVVSRDNGKTWDLDHRYILAAWVGKIKGPTAWYQSSQATSSVLLPDGSILTVFGTGYRCNNASDGHPAPRDVGLVRWRVDGRGLNRERTMRDAPPASDARNVTDPGPAIAAFGNP